MKKILLRRVGPLLCCMVLLVSFLAFPVSAEEETYLEPIDWQRLVEKSEIIAGKEVIHLSLPTNRIWTYPFYRWEDEPYAEISGIESFWGNGSLGPNLDGFVFSPTGTILTPGYAYSLDEWGIVEGYCLDVSSIPKDTTATIKLTLTLDWFDEEHEKDEWYDPSVYFCNWSLDTGFSPFSVSMGATIYSASTLHWDDGVFNVTYDITFPLFPDEVGVYSVFAFEICDLPPAYYKVSYDSLTMNISSESLQSEDAKTNELLQSILDARNGTTNPKPPSGSGSVGDLGSMEDYLLNGSADGRDEFNSMVNSALNFLPLHVSAFSFMSIVFDSFVEVGWLRGVLVISLSLGVLGFIANVGFKAAGDSRAGKGSSGKGGKG